MLIIPNINKTIYSVGKQIFCKYSFLFVWGKICMYCKMIATILRLFVCIVMCSNEYFSNWLTRLYHVKRNSSPMNIFITMAITLQDNSSFVSKITFNYIKITGNKTMYTYSTQLFVYLVHKEGQEQQDQ